MLVGGSWGMGAWAHCCSHCRRVAEFSFLHGAAVGLTWFGTYPAQGAVLGAHLEGANFIVPVLLFLPAIIKTLAAWMYGWWAVLYILPTALFQHAFLGLSFDGGQLVMLMVYLVIAPLVKSSLELFGFDFATSRESHSWRSLLSIMVVASVATAGTFVVLDGRFTSLPEVMAFVLLWVVGDLAGAALVLLSLILVFRAKDRFQALLVG